MNTHESYISLETAKMLKEAGFDWECRMIHYCYIEDDHMWNLEDNYKPANRVLKLDYCLLAPTLDVAQRWLREVKNIYLYAYPDFVRGSDINPVWQIKYKYKIEYWSRYYDTYELALEAGIKKVLEIILEKGE